MAAAADADVPCHSVTRVPPGPPTCGASTKWNPLARNLAMRPFICPVVPSSVMLLFAPSQPPFVHTQSRVGLACGFGCLSSWATISSAFIMIGNVWRSSPTGAPGSSRRLLHEKSMFCTGRYREFHGSTISSSTLPAPGTLTSKRNMSPPGPSCGEVDDRPRSLVSCACHLAATEAKLLCVITECDGHSRSMSGVEAGAWPRTT
mmetsp:Transcript_54001/g.166133  ORF Transcript_54001/g.166133 Transcript_54001/m.166133 type:complete len:204 (-) Transcript_54001:246-857(-)